MTNTVNNTNNKQERSPIVAVLGHVDHGKTTLLDYIRKTKLTAREAGGITQSIGAYEIIHPLPESSTEKRITFIDTPGHEAFGKMRLHGATVADLAILVVAADDGVKPQTAECIKVLKETKTPFIVAINKIDKNNADPERTKQDLLANEVFLEKYGGDISWQEISAQTGQGIPELLDLILLTAEMEELTYDSSSPAKGVIIETKMDKRRGFEAMIITRDGILKSGDLISTSTAKGKVKILENFKGERVNELTPSSPGLIIGFESLPEVGEEYLIGLSNPDIKPKKSSVSMANLSSLDSPVEVPETPNLNLIVKADTSGSLEALSQIINSLPVSEGDRQPVVKSSDVGEITDGDIKEAITLKATIIGFRVKTSKTADNLARIHKIQIINSDIIYELVQAVSEKIKTPIDSLLQKNELEVLAVFSVAGSKQTVGGKVVSGELKAGMPVVIVRDNAIVGQTKILNLQCQKQDAKSVAAGKECGIVLSSLSDGSVAVGDTIKST